MLKKCEFFRNIFKISQEYNFTNIRPIGDRAVPCGQQTDRYMTNLIVAFRSLAKWPIHYFQSHSFTSALSSSCYYIERDEILH